MTDKITRNTIAADLFAELSEQGKAEAIYESDAFNMVLASVVAAYTGNETDKANLGRAVLACIDDFLRPEIDKELASFEPPDYQYDIGEVNKKRFPAFFQEIEHDAQSASNKIDRDNAKVINWANRGCFDPQV